MLGTVIRHLLGRQSSGLRHLMLPKDLLERLLVFLYRDILAPIYIADGLFWFF